MCNRISQIRKLRSYRQGVAREAANLLKINAAAASVLKAARCYVIEETVFETPH